MKLKLISCAILACFLTLSLDCGLFKNWRKGKGRRKGKYSFHQVEQIHIAHKLSLLDANLKL